MTTDYKAVWLNAPGFPRCAEDDDLPNDGMSGFKLISHIAAALKARGFQPEEPIGEDFGYALGTLHADDGRKLYVMLSSTGDAEFRLSTDPDTDTVTRWIFFKEDVRGAVSRLRAALFDIAASSEGLEVTSWEDAAGEMIKPAA